MPKVTRGAITLAKNPSLWRRDATLWCAVTSRVDSGYYLYSSDDFGRNWTQITMATIWNGDDYYKASACGLSGGGAATVAAGRGTSPMEIYFKKTADETTWPADADAVLIGTYTGTAKQFSIRQKQEAGRADLIVTNGVDAQWISYDLGRTWTTY